jgi:hypothetical protein
MFARAHSSRLHAPQLHRNTIEHLQQHGVALIVELHDGTALNVQARSLAHALPPTHSPLPPSHSGHVSRVLCLRSPTLCTCSPTLCTPRLRNTRKLADVLGYPPKCFHRTFRFCFSFSFVLFSSVVSAEHALPLQALKPRLLYEVCFLLRMLCHTFTSVPLTSHTLLPGTAKL